MNAAEEREVLVLYFALLREQAGRTRETVVTRAATARELYDELSASRGLALGRAYCRVAVNDEFVSWDAPLRAGDTVAFIPPVAGG